MRTAFAAYMFSLFGVFLIAAPWSPIWTAVTAFADPTDLGPWLRSGWVRGLVSGLGALDLVAGIAEGVSLVAPSSDIGGRRGMR